MKDQNTFITEQGLKKLKQELQILKGDKRKEISERIQQAKELGDLSENAEYVDAKNEQAFIEGRVQEIDNILRHATIIKQNKNNNIISVGSKIKIKDALETKEYFIVGSSEADPSKGKISNESPIGQAFLGKKVGDIIEIRVPQGSKKFEIIAIA
ncbi:MAG: transcription elongation factor GreA [Patescibacteria group bacterium]|nr:transcription elongation factor GreA [Patescibacteria group bacterium]